jgi:hypothetical protein
MRLGLALALAFTIGAVTAPSTAQTIPGGLTNFDVIDIQFDIQDTWSALHDSNSYLAQFFRANNKQITGDPHDLLVFAALFAGVPIDQQKEVMEQIIPLPSRRYIEILGSGYGPNLFALCPMDARGFVDCK